MSPLSPLVPLSPRAPRSALRLGAAAALTGVVLTLVAFAAVFLGVVDPFAPISPERYMTEITQEPTLWLAVHLVVALAVLAKLGGLLTLGETLEGPGRSVVVRMANAFAVVGAALLVLTMARDGYVHAYVAESWRDAGSASDAWVPTFAASLRTSYAVEITSVIALLGCAPIAYGVAMLASPDWPHWLARLGIASGLGGLATGTFLWMTGPSDIGYGVLYPPFAVVLPAVWLTLVARRLWQQGGQQAGRPAAPLQAPAPTRPVTVAERRTPAEVVSPS